MRVLACVVEMCACLNIWQKRERVLACVVELCAHVLACVVEMCACFSVCGRNVCMF